MKAFEKSRVKKEEAVVVDLCDSDDGKKDILAFAEDDSRKRVVVDLCDSDDNDIHTDNKDTNGLVKKENESTMTEAMIVTPSPSPLNNKRRRSNRLKRKDDDAVYDENFKDYEVGSGDMQKRRHENSQWFWNLEQDGSPSIWLPNRIKVKREGNDTAAGSDQEEPGSDQEESNESKVETEEQNVGPDEIASACIGGEANESKVKREQVKREAARNEAMEKHGPKILLHRFNPGIASLGGCMQNTFQRPGKSFLVDGKPPPGYPVPHQGIKQNADGTIGYYLNGFTSLCYNTTWQPNGPKFAGQPTAAVDDLPDYMKTEGLVLPVFMKRSLTKKDHGSENHVLGWEYVGNYRCITDEDVIFWESADNFTKASKKEIANKMYQSSQSISDNTYGTTRLAWWREHLENERKKEKNDENESNANSIATRAEKLGYTPDISNKDLCHLLVNLDEFHRQEAIEFVEYDERIYEFCSKGLTTKNSKGQTLKTHGGEPATASDYYNHAMEQMLM